MRRSLLGLVLLELGPPVLEPDLDLDLLERKRRCQMFATSLAQVRTGVELCSQGCQLTRIEVGPGSFLGRSDRFLIRGDPRFSVFPWT